MPEKLIHLLQCPSCDKPLTFQQTVLVCGQCQSSFSIKEYWVDFTKNRPSSDVLERTLQLEHLLPESSWKQLVMKLANQTTHCTPSMKSVLYDYTINGMQRASERLKRAMDFADVLGWRFRLNTALDMGCGTGGALPALAAQFHIVIGYDISPENLTVARKLIQEKQLKNVFLVLGDGGQLPFQGRTFDFIMGIDFLHHIYEPQYTLQEMNRILTDTGVLAFDSTNRFTLFAPEPHVKIRGVSLLPRAWQESYVHWRLGISYAHHHARLLSLRELTTLLRSVFSNQQRLYSPVLWKQHPRYFEKPLRWIRIHLPWFAAAGHWLFLIFISNHEFIARKHTDSDTCG